jgi:hypothetical protein
MQTADKIQIALLCVQIFVALVQVVTTYFFIRSVGITQKQEKDAKDQILLAQKQMDLMASQYRESLRPLIAVAYKVSGSGLHEIELRNEGSGPALDVKCDQAISLQGTVIGSRSAVLAYVPQQPSETSAIDFFIVTYKSLDGQYYGTCFYQQSATFSVVDYRQLGITEDLGLLREFRSGFLARVGRS